MGHGVGYGVRAECGVFHKHAFRFVVVSTPFSLVILRCTDATPHQVPGKVAEESEGYIYRMCIQQARGNVGTRSEGIEVEILTQGTTLTPAITPTLALDLTLTLDPTRIPVQTLTVPDLHPDGRQHIDRGLSLC